MDLCTWYQYSEKRVRWSTNYGTRALALCDTNDVCKVVLRGLVDFVLGSTWGVSVFCVLWRRCGILARID